jgi:3-hydroxyisobutyrate dehydrogenase
MLKDLLLSQEAAQSAGAETALGRRAAEIYGAFQAGGQAGVDFSGIINAIRERSGGVKA